MIALLLAIAGGDAVAQKIEQVTGVPKNETKAERKAREKKLQQLADSIAFVDAQNGVAEKYFVITADHMMLGNSGRMYNSPNASTNFILVQGDTGTVQIAFENGMLGANGLGGVTVEGMIGEIKTSKSKNGDVHYSFSILGVGISAQITIDLYKNSNQVVAIVSPNFMSDRLTVYGPLIPYKH
ncbi:MAG: DUF4251 domain-containing protein [Muribaculaceae bacterium]